MEGVESLLEVCSAIVPFSGALYRARVNKQAMTAICGRPPSLCAALFALPPPRLHHSGSSNEYYEADCAVWVELMQIGRGGFGKVTLWRNQVRVCGSVDTIASIVSLYYCAVSGDKLYTYEACGVVWCIGLCTAFSLENHCVTTA